MSNEWNAGNAYGWCELIAETVILLGICIALAFGWKVGLDEVV